MPYYLYKGKLTSEARNHILENAEKFDEIMKQSVVAFGGELVKCFWMAHSSEPAGFLIFGDDMSARSWSTYYASQSGVLSSDIRRLLVTEDLCEMRSAIQTCKEQAEAHRRT
jgi:hypothetical protein